MLLLVSSCPLHMGFGFRFHLRSFWRCCNPTTATTEKCSLTKWFGLPTWFPAGRCNNGPQIHLVLNPCIMLICYLTYWQKGSYWGGKVEDHAIRKLFYIIQVAPILSDGSLKVDNLSWQKLVRDVTVKEWSELCDVKRTGPTHLCWIWRWKMRSQS